jgi:hypothetical protein
MTRRCLFRPIRCRPREGVLTAFRSRDPDAGGGVPGGAAVPASAGRRRVREGRRRPAARRRDHLRRHLPPRRRRASAGHRGVEPVRQRPGHVPECDGRLRPGRPAQRHRLRAGEVRGPDPAYWCAQGYASATRTSAAWWTPTATACSGTGRKAATATTSSSGWPHRPGAPGKVGMSGTSYLAVSQVVHRRRAAPAPGSHQPLGRRQ